MTARDAFCARAVIPGIGVLLVGGVIAYAVHALLPDPYPERPHGRVRCARTLVRLRTPPPPARTTPAMRQVTRPAKSRTFQNVAVGKPDRPDVYLGHGVTLPGRWKLSEAEADRLQSLLNVFVDLHCLPYSSLASQAKWEVDVLLAESVGAVEDQGCCIVLASNRFWEQLDSLRENWQETRSRIYPHLQAVARLRSPKPLANPATSPLPELVQSYQTAPNDLEHLLVVQALWDKHCEPSDVPILELWFRQARSIEDQCLSAHALSKLPDPESGAALFRMLDGARSWASQYVVLEAISERQALSEHTYELAPRQVDVIRRLSEGAREPLLLRMALSAARSESWR